MKHEKFVVSAPTRCDLAGGTLDLWPLYCLFGSSRTINVAIDIRAICEFDCQPNTQQVVEIENSQGVNFSFVPNQKGLLPDKAPKELKFPTAIVGRFFAQQPVEKGFKLKIKIETQAPVGSGLGGSSTLCVALLRGLSHLNGKYEEADWRWKMLNWVRDAEAEYLKTPTGTQDYLAAIFGSLSCFTYRIGEINHETYRPSIVEELNSRLLVLFSGEMHHSGLSNWEVFKKAMEGDTNVLSGLKSLHEVAETLHQELLLKSVDWKKIGSLLTKEWNIRKTTLGVNTQRLDQIIKFLETQSVFGVKVCGAAQGGSLLALVDPQRKQQISEACSAQSIRVLPAQISSFGVRIN